MTKRWNILSTLRALLASLSNVNLNILKDPQRESLLEAFRLNREYMSFKTNKSDRKRKGFIKSVALQSLGNSRYMPHQGNKECLRRVRQGLA